MTRSHTRSSEHVAAPRGRFYVLRRLAAGCLLLLAGACAQAQAPVTTPVAGLDTVLVDSARQLTIPRGSRQVTFDWSMRDRDARFTGKGVVRVAAPYRARLDLFGPRGEGYISAVLDGEELRLPQAGMAGLLPPPAFLWASMGVFRRPSLPLTVARRTDAGFELGFAAGEERWRFVFEGGSLRNVEWLGPDGGRRTVELSGQSAPGLAQRGAYRDWVEFRELTLTVTAVEVVDAFPDDIWDIHAR